MRKDRWVFLDDLCVLIPEVSRAIIYWILTDKMCATRVPRMLTEDHKRQRVDSAAMWTKWITYWIRLTRAYHFTTETKEQSRQWPHFSSPKPRKSKQAQSAGKVMATVFWDREKVLLVDLIATGTTINADRYYERLTKLRRAIQNRRRGTLSMGVSILHDNARSYAARQTVILLQCLGGKSSLTHPIVRTWYPMTSTCFQS